MWGLFSSDVIIFRVVPFVFCHKIDFLTENCGGVFTLPFFISENKFGTLIQSNIYL